jgi:YVTN family beta-propeller protein
MVGFSRTLPRLGRLAVLPVLLIVLSIPPASASVANGVPPPRRSSSAIAFTPSGTLLLVVNPDSNTLTLVDPATSSPLIELAVGVDPRTVAVDDAGRRAYVANRVSGTLSVVDLVARTVISEVPVGRRPFGVLVSPDGSRVYVAEQGADQVRVLDADSLATLAEFPTAGRPTGLALNEAGNLLYVTHLLSGEVSVFVVSPYQVYLPLVIRGGVADGLPEVSYRAPSAPWPATYRGTIDLWPDSNLVQSIVLSPDGRRAYVPHTRSNTGNQALTFDTTVFPLVSLIDLAAQQHLTGQQLDLGTLDPPGVGLPTDAAVTPDGQELWVLNAASNDASVVDLEGRDLTAHVEVGHNPRGIVLSPDGATAYVNNTLAGTVSVIDTAAYTVTDVITVTDIPLPPVLLNGKRLFHSSDDPRVSLAQWISCNTCHFEGEHDGRTWFFGFAGPRNTTSLQGMVETYPLRWSGEWDESADSEFANRKENFGSGLIEGSMNCSLSPPDCVGHPPNQGRSYDLDCLAAFVDSLRMPLSPHHAAGEPLTGAELRGQVLFHDPELNCVECHPPPLYTDLAMHDVGTATVDERIGPAYDTPTLRGLYDSAPYFHDGSASTLLESLTRPSLGSEHDLGGLLTEDEMADLITFLLALPFEQ